MGVLDVENWIVIAAQRDDLKVKGQRRIHGVPDQRVSCGIDPHFVNELIKGDDVAGTF